MLRFTVMVAGVLVLVPSCGRKLWQAPDPNTHASAITALVQAAMESTRESTMESAGASAIVARVQTPKGTLVITLGKDKPGGQDVTAFHRFGIRDVTSALTATAILMLVQENTLVLTDPISKFVPGAPESVTLTHLLAMRSGIPDFSSSTLSTLSFSPDQEVSAFDLLASIDMTPAFTPGEQFEYSRTNSVLLGEVITSVSGQPWHDFLRARILEPLKLFRTELPSGSTPSQPFALGSPTSFSQFQAAGGLASTAEEVETLGKALAEGAFLSAFMHQTRLQLSACDGDERCDSYGYGIMQNGGLLGFSGAWSGYSAAVFHENSSEMTITILTNTTTALTPLVRDIAQTLGFSQP